MGRKSTIVAAVIAVMVAIGVALAALQPWLERARDSGIGELREFASTLRRDLGAIDAALTHEWSNGQTEGQVNRLKALKRQMFGRAKLDLLRKRFLHAA